MCVRLDDQVDVVIIGGGPGGYVAAIKAGQLGLKTVCVEERGALGGTCLNVGCIPSKALLNISHFYHMAKHDMPKMGIGCKFSDRDNRGGGRRRTLCCVRLFLSRDSHKRLLSIVDGVRLDISAMMKQKLKAVEGLTKGVEILFRKNKVDYLKGHGRISSPHEVTVKMNDGSTRILHSKNIIIATGSEPINFPGLEVSECRLLSHHSYRFSW